MLPTAQQLRVRITGEIREGDIHIFFAFVLIFGGFEGSGKVPEGS